MAMAVASETPRTRRFTAEEVWRMVATGVLGRDEPYELINGELRYVSPQDPPHAGAVRRLTAMLVSAYGPEYDVAVQLPIGGIDDSIPEPDLAVTSVRGINDPHPCAHDTLLIIEVAATSLRNDLDKALIFAAAGCPEYWIVDITGQRVITHHGPRADGTWLRVDEVNRAESLTFPGTGQSVDVAAFMPRPHRSPAG